MRCRFTSLDTITGLVRWRDGAMARTLFAGQPPKLLAVYVALHLPEIASMGDTGPALY